MTDLSIRLQATFAQTKTVCFGRFVITVPVRTKVVFGRMTVGPEIFFAANESSNMEQYIAEKRDKVEKARDLLDDELKRPGMFGKLMDGAAPGHKLLVGGAFTDYALFSFLPLSTGLFLFETNSFMPSMLNEMIAEHVLIARLLRPRTDDDIPTGKGVCLDGGFIDQDNEFENTSIGFRLEDFPDVHLSLSLMKNQAHVPSDDFDLRLTWAEKLARADGLGPWWDKIQILRRGPRSVLEWPGREIVSWKPARAGFHEASHEFIFWSAGRANDPYHPTIEAKLHTGVKENKRAATPPSLTNQEAVALWDKLLGSIRVRPIAPAMVEGPDFTPGISVTAGQQCPKAGWWECQDTAHYGKAVEVRGGAVRYFREGNAMPQAILQKQAWWQRVTGARDLLQNSLPSQWRLLDRREQQRDAKPVVAPTASLAATTSAAQASSDDQVVAPRE